MSLPHVTKIKYTLPEALAASYKFLSVKERRKYANVLALSLVSGAMDIISLMAVYPLISLIVQPDLLQTNDYINQVWTMLGRSSVTVFVTWLALGTSMMILVSASISFFAQVGANRFAASSQERLGHELMEKMLDAPYVWHLQHNPLVLADLFQNHLLLWSRDVIRRIATLVGQIVAVALPTAALIVWSPIHGTVILIIVIALVSIGYKWLSRRTRSLLKQKKQAEQRLRIFLSEVLQGIKDVKLSSHEADFLQEFKQNYHITSRSFSAVNSWNLVPTHMVLLAGQFGLLGVSVGLFLNGIEGGQLAAAMAVVMLVVARIFPAINRIGSAINGLGNANDWIKTLDEIVASLKKVSISQYPDHGKVIRWPWNEITISNVSFTYPNSGKPALLCTNLQLHRGGSYAFTGSSGSGKSTLVDLILGLYSPTSGVIKIDEEHISEANRKSWQVGIGYVPQMPILIDATLRENVAFGVPKDCINDDRVQECLQLTDLSSLLRDLPSGINTSLGDRGVRLSGGQRQRVALARALYHNPDVLVLDEATSSLDTVSEHAIRDALLKLRGKVTIISIAHRFSTIRAADCIFLLEQGQVIAQGSYETLVKESSLFRRLAETLVAEDE